MLLERDRLTSGTTWHAAGLMVTFGSTSETSTEMRKYTRDLYAPARGRDRPVDRASSRCGFIEVAARSPTGSRSTAASRRSTATAASTSTRSRRREVKELFPLARTDDILAGFYVKEDGRANPVDVTMALAKGARMQGATIIEGVRGHRRHCTKRGAVTGVRRPRTATSRPSTSSTAPACGRASSARRRASTSRCRRPSTTTSSPSAIAGLSTSTGRCSRIPARTATSARRSAA